MDEIQCSILNGKDNFLYSIEYNIFKGQELANNNSKFRVYEDLKSTNERYIKDSIIKKSKKIILKIDPFKKDRKGKKMNIDFLLLKDINANFLVENIKTLYK